jgi:serine/threonine protein kinase
LSDLAKDFLLCCFAPSPDDRASAQELLDHPFLQEWALLICSPIATPPVALCCSFTVCCVFCRQTKSSKMKRDSLPLSPTHSGDFKYVRIWSSLSL